MNKGKRITYTRDGTKRTRKAPGKRQRKELDEENVLTLPVKRKQYFVWDTGAKGLHVLVSPGGARTYRSLWYYDGSSKPHSRSLGRVGTISLEKARELCRADQRAAKEYIDPKSEGRLASDLFEAVVNEYIDREQIARKRNATAEEVRRVILKDCAIFKQRPIASIRPTEIETLLDQIRDGDGERRGRPYLANKVWAALCSMFRWAVKKRKLAVSPMASIDKPWEGTRPRDRVFSNAELKKLWEAKLEDQDIAFLRLLILTGKRRGALAEMRWREINDDWYWQPPPGNKNKLVHPLPMPTLAQHELARIRPKDAKPDDLVFGELNWRFQNRVKAGTGIDDFFPHAIRHTVETKLAELKVPPHLRDLLLDHAPMRGSGKGYDHWDYKDEKREAMEKWAAYIERVVLGDEKVIAFEKARA